MRYAARRDENERDLVGLARMLGFWMVKAPPLDYWACLRQRWRPVEIKRAHKRSRPSAYTDLQHEFFERCGIECAPHEIWATDEDVLKALREWT